MGEELEELDLTKPGKLWAKAECEKDTIFHLVMPQAGYTKENLSKNPSINPRDELMRPWTVPFTGEDKEGMTYCDLDASGRAAEIMNNLAQLYEQGVPRVETVRGVYIATARDGNRVPDNQVAETKDFKLVTIPTVGLKVTGPNDPFISYLTVQLYKTGKKDFKVELHVSGPVTEVQLTTTPASPMKTSLGPSGNGTLVLPIQEGQKCVITIPAPFKQRLEQRTERRRKPYIHYYPGGWRSAGDRDMLQAHMEREVWDGGIITLRAAGTGAYKNIIRSVKLEAVAWGAAWVWKDMPPPFYHNAC